MNKLIVLAHPNWEASKANKTLINELNTKNVDCTVHNLTEVYPNAEFDIKAEQELIEKHDEIIFQFPIHWFSTPWVLKKYLDDVFAYGWAYGPAYKLEGKNVKIAVTTGVDEKTYKSGSDVDELLKSLSVSLTFCRCNVNEDIFKVYGAMSQDEEALKKAGGEYAEFVSK